MDPVKVASVLAIVVAFLYFYSEWKKEIKFVVRWSLRLYGLLDRFPISFIWRQRKRHAKLRVEEVATTESEQTNEIPDIGGGI